ncbi:MAG: argininosuccinate synthase, partial [Acidobacteriota bacterium]|nr:argininosuccinate synthase [Acidobacteriota bacterium]
MKPKKVALAYSGGLDTSVIIPWLKEHYGCQVVAVCGDIGQGGEELTGLEEKARKTGADEVYVADMREEFVTDYLWRMVRAGGVYEHKYLLGTSIARPLLAKKQVEVALASGCDALAHGCTGKGNDQVRFELTYKALAPHLPVIAPWREWDIVSREDALEYAAKHNVPVAQSTTKIYSRDRNIWHISHEGGELEDPANAPSDGIWMLTKSPREAPDRTTDVTIGFEKGTPVSVDGKHLGAVELLEKLNEIGAENGIGRIDLVENRFVGMKSRGCYETPGGTLIMAAHRELEALTLDRNTLHYKQKLALDYAEMVYNGLWFTPLREALDAFFDAVGQTTTGEVTMRL